MKPRHSCVRVTVIIIVPFLIFFSSFLFLISQLSMAGEHKREHRYIRNWESGVTLLVGTTTHMDMFATPTPTPTPKIFNVLALSATFSLLLQYKTVPRVFAHSYMIAWYIYDQILIPTLNGLKVTMLQSHPNWPPHHIEKGLVNLQVFKMRVTNLENGQKSPNERRRLGFWLWVRGQILFATRNFKVYLLTYELHTLILTNSPYPKISRTSSFLMVEKQSTTKSSIR